MLGSEGGREGVGGLLAGDWRGWGNNSPGFFHEGKRENLGIAEEFSWMIKDPKEKSRVGYNITINLIKKPTRISFLRKF